MLDSLLLTASFVRPSEFSLQDRDGLQISARVITALRSLMTRAPPGLRVRASMLGTGCEQMLLYQLVEAHYPAFVEHLAARDRTLPVHVEREFEDYLKCGRSERGFLRVRCADCHAERRVAFSCKRRG